MVDLTGRIFGQLTVIRFSHKNKEYFWECLCACGNTTYVRTNSLLRQGGTKSCGCINGKRTHGMSRTRTYCIWENMVQRCTNPNSPGSKWYSARGITVCKEWRDFATFYKDMGEVPDKKSLDRIDNDKGYSKDNCRWVSVSQNNINRRNTVFCEYFGEMRPVLVVAEKLGIPYERLRQRLSKEGKLVRKNAHQHHSCE